MTLKIVRDRDRARMAIGLDTLKMTSIDLDVRAVTDFLIFKSQARAPLTNPFPSIPTLKRRRLRSA